MYCEAKGNICKVLKNSLQESLDLAPIIILIILFWSLNMLILSMEFPQSLSPYVIAEWK